MPELKTANEEIERTVREFEARQARLSCFKQHLAATDRVLDLLERMNLQGTEFVGAAGARRMSRPLQLLPPSLRPAVGPRTQVQRALDKIFAVQAVLFSRHLPGHRRVRAEEHALFA